MGGLWAGGLLPLCERRGDDAAVTMWFFWFKFISSCLRLMENCIDSLVAGSFFFLFVLPVWSGGLIFL
jgi:hypothetical protein